MSNSHIFKISGFVSAPLANGVGRYVCQLQRLTIKFCKASGSSRGVREFIEHDLVSFAKENPNIVVYLKPRRHRDPVAVGEYLNGQQKNLVCKDFTRDQFIGWLNLFKTQANPSAMRLRKLNKTNNPSIQGLWTPFTHRDPKTNIAEYPNEEMSKVKCQPPSATEQLLDMYKRQLEEQNNTSS